VSASWPLAQFALIYLYVCLPRLVLATVSRDPASAITRGFLDRRLAYVGVLVPIYLRVARRWPSAARVGLLVWLQLGVVVETFEAGLVFTQGLGFSPLVFYHLTWSAIAVAGRGYWPLLLAAALIIALGGELLRRVLRPAAVTEWTLAHVAVYVVIAIFGVRSVDILRRHAIPSEFGPVALVMNWRVYENDHQRVDRVRLTSGEKRAIQSMGLETEIPSSTAPVVPARPRMNLITVYLEGFQANFSGAWQSPVPGLTPRLDAFADRFIRFESFYNAVTPTINALISSQCGILSDVENDYLSVDQGYTRNLACLPDYLHRAGYYQVFLGGANTGFARKGEFLRAHAFDEVWGWEQWESRKHQTPNAWGLQDTDLVGAALVRLPELEKRGPFHLSLLTVNSHPPGFAAPDCPPMPGKSSLLSAIHCTDHAVGTLLDALEAGGYFENTVVMIMGDHMMFPSEENADLLGPLAGQWFGKVFMAMEVPRLAPRTIRTPAYTPDFASIALDALGVRPVPAFVVGRSPLSSPDPRMRLVARHFEIRDNVMIGLDPYLTDRCSAEELAQTEIHTDDAALSDCERDKILDVFERETFVSTRRR